MNAQNVLDTAMQRAENGAFEEAIESVSSLIEQMPEEGALYQALGSILFRASNFPDAVLVLDRAAELLPASADVWELLGIAQAQIGQHGKSLQSFVRVLELRDGNASFSIFLNIGNAHFALDDAQGAEVAFRRAVTLNPDADQAWGNLGLSLKAQGKRQVAIQAFQRAASLQPKAIEYRLNWGNTLADLGDFEKAEVLLREVCAQQPACALAWAALGRAFNGVGKNDLAIEALRKACEIEPESAQFHLNCGAMLASNGYVTEPLEHFQKAIHLKPDYWSAWVDMGNLLGELGKVEKSKRCFEIVLERRPKHPDAAAGLAVMLNRAGQHTAALDLVAPLVEQGVGLTVNLVVAYVTACIGVGRPEQCVVFMERMLREPLAKPEMSLLFHTYAKLMDKLKRWDQAFIAYKESNALRCLNFDPKRHEQEVTATIDAFGTEALAKWKGLGSDSDSLVFVVGMPRSGTSLVEQILCSHSDVFGAGELEFVRLIAGQIGEYGNGSLSSGLSAIDPKMIRGFADTHLQNLSGKAGGASLFTDKMPGNYKYLGLIQVLYPNAKIIHCRRNRLDTCISCFRQNFNGSYAYTTRLDWLASYYTQYERLMAHWLEVIDLPVYEVDYEQLVAHPHQEIPSLVKFLDVEVEEACLNPHENERVVHTASHAQVRQPIYTSSVGYAQRYAAHIAALLNDKEAA